MIKSILALGDSFTYGDELPDAGYTRDPAIMETYIYDKPSTLAWPSILANLLNADVNNMAMSAGSNGRIFRLATDLSLKKPVDLVVCGWTDISRPDFIYKHVDMPVTFNSTWFEKPFPWIKDNWFKYHYHDDYGMQQWLTQVITLQNHFKQKKQKYIFVKSFGSDSEYNIMKKFQYLADEIDSAYYIGFRSNEAMIDWMGDCPKGKLGHPLELGHERIATKLYEHIRNLGWIS
jgi:hypothetical protein